MSARRSKPPRPAIEATRKFLRCSSRFEPVGPLESSFHRFERSADLLGNILFDSHEIEVEAGWEALEALINRLPDDDPALADAFAALAQSPASLIRQAVAEKEAITEETVAALASDPTPEVIHSLVSSQRKKISEPALRQIIGRNWSLINREIAGNVERYDQADTTGVSKLLAASADPSVRAALASNSDAPKVVIRRLLNDPDGEVRRLARATLAARY